MAGNHKLMAHRTLAGESLPTYLNSDTSLWAGRSRTPVTSTSPCSPGIEDARETGTPVRIEMTGQAVSPGSSSEPVQCRSIGRLERRIAGMLQERIGS